MNISKLVAVSAWLFTFFFHVIHRQHRSGNSSLRYRGVGGFGYRVRKYPSGGDNNELTSQEV